MSLRRSSGETLLKKLQSQLASNQISALFSHFVWSFFLLFFCSATSFLFSEQIYQLFRQICISHSAQIKKKPTNERRNWLNVETQKRFIPCALSLTLLPSLFCIASLSPSLLLCSLLFNCCQAPEKLSSIKNEPKKEKKRKNIRNEKSCPRCLCAASGPCVCRGSSCATEALQLRSRRTHKNFSDIAAPSSNLTFSPKGSRSSSNSKKKEMNSQKMQPKKKKEKYGKNKLVMQHVKSPNDNWFDLRDPSGSPWGTLTARPINEIARDQFSRRSVAAKFAPRFQSGFRANLEDNHINGHQFQAKHKIPLHAERRSAEGSHDQFASTKITFKTSFAYFKWS